MSYESLLMGAEFEGLIVKELALKASDGMICGDKIAIRKNITTSIEKACVLAEELGHFYTSGGDIIDQCDCLNRQQEERARAWAYNMQIGISGLIDAFNYGCTSYYDTAEYLDVTELFLRDCICYYAKKYGNNYKYNEYLISFVPSLIITKFFYY